MFLKRNQSLLIIITLLTVLIFSGCAPQQTPSEEPSTEVEEVEEIDDYASLISAFEIFQADNRELLAYVHGDHWDGALPFIQEGDALEVDVRVENSAGDLIYPDDTLSLGTHIMHGAEDIISFDFNEDHLLIGGTQPGETRIVFSLAQDDEVVFQTPPLRVTVVEQAAGAEPVEVPEVYSYDLIDRNQDRVIADVHGDHWDGSIPPVTNGDYVSVGAVIKDDQGQNILLDGQPFSAAARIADEGQDGLVSFDFHGDHLYIIGESTGETMLVFMLLADDETVFETPPIAVKVVD